MTKSSIGNHRVLIVGCGNLGSRHLQAVASLPCVSEIEIVDPRPEALAKGRQLLSELPQHQSSVSFRWVSSLEKATKGGDLCVVATQAKGRSELMHQIFELLGYRKFLIEKIVTQSVRDYEQLLDFTKRKELAVWVNCKSRAYPIHKRIKSRLNPSEPLIFTVVGGNHGLANYGIHVADLFAFYTGGSLIEKRGGAIDPVLHPSKRGSDLFDLSGTLIGVTKEGHHFTAAFAKDHVCSDQILVQTKNYRCIVDAMQQWVFESESESGKWHPFPFEGNLLVSQMTKTFVDHILNTGHCELPTLEACYPAHHFILGGLLPSFNKILNRESDICPVT